MKKNLPNRSHAQLPSSIRRLLDQPALLKTEDSSLYFELRQEIAEHVQPQGVIEWLWVDDYAYRTFDIQRLRAIKTHLLSDSGISWHDVVKTFETDDEDDDAKLVADNIKDNSKSDLARAYQMSSDKLEKIENLLLLAERRKDSILREIAVHRELFARQLKDVSTRIIEAKETISTAAS